MPCFHYLIFRKREINYNFFFLYAKDRLTLVFKFCLIRLHYNINLSDGNKKTEMSDALDVQMLKQPKIWQVMWIAPNVTGTSRLSVAGWLVIDSLERQVPVTFLLHSDTVTLGRWSHFCAHACLLFLLSEEINVPVKSYYCFFSMLYAYKIRFNSVTPINFAFILLNIILKLNYNVN